MPFPDFIIAHSGPWTAYCPSFATQSRLKAIRQPTLREVGLVPQQETCRRFHRKPRPASSSVFDDLPVSIVHEFRTLRQEAPYCDYAGHQTREWRGADDIHEQAVASLFGVVSR